MTTKAILTVTAKGCGNTFLYPQGKAPAPNNSRGQDNTTIKHDVLLGGKQLMSLHEYLKSQDIARLDFPFYSLIMAAM
jgi:hypothetical protein